MRVFGITGYKNAGKTTLVEKLVAEFVARGVRVSTVKHAHHAFDVDTPGRDSHRHRVAGASEVLVTSRYRWALMHENRHEPEPPLSTLLSRLSPVDLILVEGFKKDAHPKIEVFRSAAGHSLMAPLDPSIRAVASDSEMDAPCPVLPLGDVIAIADFVAGESGL